jgi:pilus assembly protein CpaB
MAKLTKVLAVGLIVLAVLLGLYAWIVGRRPPPQSAQQSVSSVATFPVVVASKSLPAGQPITADALRIQQMQSIPTSSFSEMASLIGRVPIGVIDENTPVLGGQLASGLASRLDVGERAIAVKVDETTGVGNRVHPGDYVDVFFVLHRDNSGAGEAEIDRTQARLLLSRVRVLAYGSAVLGGADSNTANQNTTNRVDNVRTAVLAVSTEQVDRLALADNSGHLVLALRNPKDPDAVDDKLFAPFDAVLAASGKSAADLSGSDRAAAGLALDTLAGEGNHKKPSTVRPVNTASKAVVKRAHSIEVIRGGQRESVAY